MKNQNAKVKDVESPSAMTFLIFDLWF